MSNDMFGFDDADDSVLSGGRRQDYKGKKNQTDRIAFVWFGTDAEGNPLMGKEHTPKFIKGMVHYHEQLGYFLEIPGKTGARFGEARMKLATIVVQYPTDTNGTIDKARLKNGEIKVMVWKISPEKFKQLRAVHEDFPLTFHDVKVTCTDDKFQKQTFTPTANEALWRQVPELRERVLAEVAQVAATLDLGRKLTWDEIRSKMGEEVEAAPDVVSGYGADDLLQGLDD
jgi:hypothetical protein